MEDYVYKVGFFLSYLFFPQSSMNFSIYAGICLNTSSVRSKLLFLQFSNFTNCTKSLFATLPLQSIKSTPSESRVSIFLKSACPTPTIIILRGRVSASTSNQIVCSMSWISPSVIISKILYSKWLSLKISQLFSQAYFIIGAKCVGPENSTFEIACLYRSKIWLIPMASVFFQSPLNGKMSRTLSELRELKKVLAPKPKQGINLSWSYQSKISLMGIMVC